METNEFIDKLLGQVSLDAVEFVSDVERILAEQVVFLRAQLDSARQEAVTGAHERIRELHERLADKDTQIAELREDVRFLRTRLTSRAG